VILFEITGNENHPVYQALEISNGNRQYDFLRSIVVCSLDMGRPFLCQHVIKALNFHAITCLHTSPGEFRPCEVTVGEYHPPAHYRVQALMDDFVNTVNRNWESTDPVVLAAFARWRINSIHPFINGNGRTARAASYFVLCVKAGGWLPGEIILPELLRQNRDEYVQALKAADQSLEAGQLDLTQLHRLFSRLLTEQMRSAGIDAPNAGDAQPDAPETPSEPP
jgi:Fic/DOC family